MCDQNGSNSGTAAIDVLGTDNTIDGNTVTDSMIGLSVSIGGNLITRNRASGKGGDYAVVGGNDLGTIRTTPIGAGAWDNFSY